MVDKSFGFTICAVPKSFEDGHVAMLQNNAIRSWTELGPVAEIILCGDDAGVADAAQRFGTLHIGGVKCVDSGQPFLNDVVARTQQIASNDVIVYISADIVLFRDFAGALEATANYFPNEFVMIGARWDWASPVAIDFSGDWISWVIALAKKQGHKHSDYGMDYFAFRRGVFDSMLEYIVGWYAWDNALVLDIVERKIPLVNATHDVFAIHQNHPERIRDRGKVGTAWQRIWNLNLAGGLPKLREGGGGHIGRSNWKLADGKLSTRGSR